MSPRVQHEQRFFERPGLLEIPRRIKFIYFFASTRLMQRIIMVSCRLLITFANRLDPDEARQNVGPDQDQICVTL